ncbi:DUF1161 domain-containing protein [Candidatus Electronema sp. JC]|uniref:DUF1161 domain-containing protein n=1 Tax=Candidatus Electronema sp. JC TaxID=3401570 RepID=UPI003B428737
MVRFMLLFAAALLCLSQAAAAVKPCAELQAEIEAKLAARSVKSYELIVADKGMAVAGKVVGACEGGSKRIIYLRTRTDQSAPVVVSAPALPPAPEQAAAEAPKPAEAATAPVLRNDAPVVKVRMIEASKPADIKSCAELEAEIKAKLAAKGVKEYELVVSDRNAPAAGKVVGICENSSKKITYSKK